MAATQQYLQKRSVLRNRQVTELKTLEKEGRKKRGNLKEQWEKKIEEAIAKHAEELRELDLEFGVQVQAHTPADGAKTADSGPKQYCWPECDWNSLSKRDLEREAALRGVGKKGNREDLVTKLQMFHSEQRSRIARGELDPNALPPPAEDKRKGAAVAASGDSDSSDTPRSAEVRSAAPAAPLAAASKFLKNAPPKNKAKNGDAATKRASPRSGSSSSDADDDSSSDSSSSSSDSGADSDVERRKKTDADLDIPDTDKMRGGKVDARAALRRRNMRKDKARGRKRHDADEPGEPTEEERQQKRCIVLQGLLIKILKKHPQGLKVDNVEAAFKKAKVANLDPKLLGFDTLREWVLAQPSQVLFYDRSADTIEPARVGMMLPSDSSSEEE